MVSCGSQVLLLGTKSFQVVTVRSWVDRLDHLVRTGHMQEALQLALDIYQDKAQAIVGLKHRKERRQQVLGRVCVCVCVCVCVYLPSCIVQGLSWAHGVLSPYLHLSSFSLNLCTLCAVIIPLSNAFHFSTILCGKLFFPISFTHCLILIFFSSPLVLPSSSVNSTRSSLSIFSISFTIVCVFTYLYLPICVLQCPS
ncbi:Vacuolar protein sorting-associated protein 8 [Portunus trituberculatus]|uniref:Vacuolar protein sorting-associated protein 8 n=1 Tax=Portunus trituberculatus TaxID=210409 RepID=A0A5B7IEU5_PORTR|nr:Vacuolar protein sorting-associated protein 8 [Portunus trituberculatus]